MDFVLLLDLLEVGDREGEFEDAYLVEDDGGSFAAVDDLYLAFEAPELLGLCEDAVPKGDGVFGEHGGFVFHIALCYLEDFLEGDYLSVGHSGEVGEVVLGQFAGWVFDVSLQVRAETEHLDAIGFVDTDEDFVADDELGLWTVLYGSIGLDAVVHVESVEDVDTLALCVALGLDDIPGGGVEDLRDPRSFLLLVDDFVGGLATESTIFSLLLLHGSAARPLFTLSCLECHHLDIRVFFHTHIQAVRPDASWNQRSFNRKLSRRGLQHTNKA